MKNETVNVDLHEALKYFEWRRVINNAKLSNLRFFEGDKEIKVNPETIDEWEFTGLTNLDFINGGFYDMDSIYHKRELREISD